MSSTGSGYDLSPTTFSPDGRVFQVEYAHKAVEQSGTAIGIKCVDGVVMGVEKMIISKMLVAGSNRRIHTLDRHAGMAISGLAADGRQLVNKGRKESTEYRSTYGSEIPGKVLADRLAGFMHMHTIYWYLRPFGCSALVSTFDAKGPQLYCMHPSGVSYRYFASAIGKHARGSATELERINFETVTCKEAVNKIAEIIYKLHDDIKDKDFELELSWVCEDSKRKHVMVPKELAEAAVKMAVDAKEKAEMDDSDSDDDDDDDAAGGSK